MTMQDARPSPSMMPGMRPLWMDRPARPIVTVETTPQQASDELIAAYELLARVDDGRLYALVEGSLEIGQWLTFPCGPEAAPDTIRQALNIAKRLRAFAENKDIAYEAAKIMGNEAGVARLRKRQERAMRKLDKVPPEQRPAGITAILGTKVRISARWHDAFPVLRAISWVESGGEAVTM